MQVFPTQDNFYAQWRAQSGVVAALREGDAPPPEHLLQAVWQHQRLRRDQLTTLDGRSVRVLHPGFISREGGPDFRGAVIQFANDPPRTGDVEVDIHPAGWRAHGHDRNPNFQSVILQVVWKAGSQTQGPPVLALSEWLDAPLPELNLWLSGEPGESLPEYLRGQCCAPLRELSSGQLSELLREAGQVRFGGKAAQFQSRARQVGWERALWEGLFRALGYKHNTWPMQCLAETHPRWFASGCSAQALQARLFGLSGLLPAELTRTQASADDYLRRIWNQWWRERDEFADCVLPRSLWKFHGLRPANHPQRRLALVAHWLAAGDLTAKLERWCVADLSRRLVSPKSDEGGSEAKADSLLEILQVQRDEFWSWHWTIRSARLKKPQPLLGAARVTDLAVNVILPWLWARAVEGRNEKLQRSLQERFCAWPAAEDNSILKLARQRLLGGAGRGVLKTAAAQQGLIQIVRDFCERTNALCEGCRFPDLVQQWKNKKGGE